VYGTDRQTKGRTDGQDPCVMRPIGTAALDPNCNWSVTAVSCTAKHKHTQRSTAFTAYTRASDSWVRLANYFTHTHTCTSATKQYNVVPI